jgi:tripartite-type tricarboxylate transporter receptor subunit TctC
LQAEVLKQREHLEKMATVVFKGGGDALKALLDGTVQLSSGVLAPAHPHIKSGTIVGLAVTGSKRWHDLPEIPTMLEVGYKDFVFETYTALVATAKIPPEIRDQLEKLALGILNKPAMREKLTKSGFDVQAKDGKGHLARVTREVKMYHDIITNAGIKKL